MSGDEEETHGFVTHNVCCCISPEEVAEGKRAAYKQGAKEAVRELFRDDLCAEIPCGEKNDGCATLQCLGCLLSRIDSGEWPKEE